MKIAILIIATNKYISFLQALISSMDSYAFRQDDVTYCVFSDQKPPIKTAREVNWVTIAHRPWPYSSMDRYRHFHDQRNFLQQFDFLFYSDADTRFVGQVTSEICADLVGVLHPGYYNAPASTYTYDNNPDCMAYVAPGQGKNYFTGAVQGGRPRAYLSACKEIVSWQKNDADKAIIPLWHDESYWNKYLSLHPPQNALSPSYYYPDDLSYGQLPFRKKILAISKKHEEMRSGAYIPELTKTSLPAKFLSAWRKL